MMGSAAASPGLDLAYLRYDSDEVAPEPPSWHAAWCEREGEERRFSGESTLLTTVVQGKLWFSGLNEITFSIVVGDIGAC